MTPQARYAAAIDILDRILDGLPAERALTGWARGARYAGSGDRAAVRDIVFDGLRRRRSAAARGGAASGRGIVLGLLREAGTDPELVFTGLGHAPAPLTGSERSFDAGAPPDDADRLDCPDWLMEHFARSLGAEAETTLEALRQRAPVFVRVNPARGTVTDAMASLASDGISARLHPDIKGAMELTDNARKLQSSAAYTTGLVEVQDASSQAAVQALPLADGMTVLDYCAGGGGKSLAMAARAEVAITAHDIDARRMGDLPARAARAGATVRVVGPEALGRSELFDLVMADAPCSGSGTWRRTPDAKWRLTPTRLGELQQIQDDVLAAAAAHVHPGGCLAYATCSLFEVENRLRVDHFIAAHPTWSVVHEMSRKVDTGGDGFYLALLKSPEFSTKR